MVRRDSRAERKSSGVGSACPRKAKTGDAPQWEHHSGGAQVGVWIAANTERDRRGPHKNLLGVKGAAGAGG